MSTLIRRGSAGYSLGMNDTATVADDFRDGECSFLLNMRPDLDSAARTRKGTRRLHGSALSGSSLGTQGMMAFATTGGANYLVVTRGLDFHYSSDGGATWTSTAGALSSSGVAVTPWVTMRAATGTNYLIFATSGNIKKWDGTTLSALASVPPTAVKHLAVANGRLWVASGADNVVYGSKVGDPETWAIPDGLRIPVGDAAAITGLAEGPDGNLFAFKQFGVSKVGGFGEATLKVEFGARGATRAVGTRFPATVTQVGEGGLCWLSDRGVEYFDGISVRLIGQGVRKFLDAYLPQTAGLASSIETTAHGFFYAERNEYWLMLPGASGNQLGVAVNLATGGGWRIQWTSVNASPRAICAGRYTNGGTTYSGPVALSHDGYVTALEIGTGDAQAAAGTGGSSYVQTFSSRHYDFGAPLNQKKARRAKLMIGGDGATSGSQRVDSPRTTGTSHTVTPINGGSTLTAKHTLIRAATKDENLFNTWTVTSTAQFRITGDEMFAQVLQGVR